MSDSKGKVTLVGAGPGDPGLLTLKGAEAIRTADVILYDYLASSLLLSHARANAEIICLGRHGHGRIWTQQEINDRMIEDADRGRHVVRVKGGDPAIFGRLAEELAALEASGTPYEIVPGISAATAAASYAGIPITHRELSSCVTFITGQERPDKENELDYAALARTPGTLVFYMGVTTAPKWSKALIEHGKPADAPAAIVKRCSLPDQTTTCCTLGDIGDLLADGKVRPPVIVIVGQVAAEGNIHNWFTSRPLFGSTVLVTRPARQALDMGSRLANLGANVLYQPAIEIAPPKDRSKVDNTCGRLGDFDWIVFSSRNGVEYYLNRLLETGHDMRALADVKIAAIGPATVEALSEYKLTADAYPETYRAEELAELLSPAAGGLSFLLIRASRGREVLAEQLTAAGGNVQQVVVYESTDVATAAEDVSAAMSAGDVTWTTVTSSAIARSLVNMFGASLRHTKLAAISPLTAGVLKELGFDTEVVADEYTTDGLIQAIVGSRQ